MTAFLQCVSFSSVLCKRMNYFGGENRALMKRLFSRHYEFHEGNFLAMMMPVGSRITVEIDLFMPILAPSSGHNPT